MSNVEQMILVCFVLGISTRKITEALLPVLRESVSVSRVSSIDQSLDQAVRTFHRWVLRRRYQIFVLDGVVLKRREGVGVVKMGDLGGLRDFSRG